jgi:predicted AAA+ superfamily ATPase
MIARKRLLTTIEERFRSNPVVLLLGPRQSGKTTLARAFAGPRSAEFFDLEAARDFDRLNEPMLALEPLRGWVVLDEAQLRPELFRSLRVLADRRPLPARFLVLGSASPDLRTRLQGLASS